MGPLLSLICLNHLPFYIYEDSKLIISTDDIGMTITHDKQELTDEIATNVFQEIIKWFSANGLSLNFDKAQYLQFHIVNGMSPLIKTICELKSVD